MNDGVGSNQSNKRKRESEEFFTPEKRLKTEDNTEILLEEVTTPLPQPTLEENITTLIQRLPLLQRERLTTIVNQLQSENLESIDSDEALRALFERLFPEMPAQTRAQLTPVTQTSADHSRSYLKMIFSGVMFGLTIYLGGPFMATLARELSPYIYESAWGSMPKMTDWQYDFIFVPLREHLSALAYHHGPKIYHQYLMLAATVLCGGLKCAGEHSLEYMAASRPVSALTQHYASLRERIKGNTKEQKTSTATPSTPRHENENCCVM